MFGLTAAELCSLKERCEAFPRLLLALKPICCTRVTSAGQSSEHPARRQ